MGNRALLFVFILFFTLSFTPVHSLTTVEEIKVTPEAIRGEIGDEIVFTITIHQLCRERCVLSIEDTKIQLYDLEKISETPWKEVEEYVFQKELKVKILSKNAKLEVRRECPKYGTISREVVYESGTSGVSTNSEVPTDSGISTNEVPEISGKELQSMTLEEVARFYGVDVKSLIYELGVDVSKDTTVRELKKYGIRPFDVKEAAMRAATAPTKKIENLPRNVATGHANYLDDLVLLVLLSIATIAFFKKKFKLKFLTLGAFFLYNFYLRESLLCTISSPQRFLLRFQEIVNGHFLEWSILFFLPIIFTLAFGRIYCGFVCPYGAYQEFLSLITKKKIEIPEKLDKEMRYLKYLLLIVLLISAAYLSDVVGREYDPFKYLFRSEGTTLTIGLLVCLTIASVFIYRPWCKYICPLGAIYTLLSRVSWFRIEYVNEKCVECALCDRACQMQAIECGKVNSYECIRCGDCIKACKRKVLGVVSNRKYAGALAVGALIIFLVLVPSHLYGYSLESGEEASKTVEGAVDYVHKETGQVYVTPGLLGKSCTPCHYSSNPSKKDLTSFALDWVKYGRNFEAIAKLDSDKDGFTNEEEWNAGTNPGDSSSKPGK